MKIERALESYRAHLADFGLSDGTVNIYCHQIRRAHDQGGVIARLRSSELAPKTKRLVRAAARHWVTWLSTRDRPAAKALRDKMERLRLPAPRRQAAKVPLERDKLLELHEAIERDDDLSMPVRSILHLMSRRGFRVGDCLRMKRTEVASAIRQNTLAYEAKGNRRLEFKVLRSYRFALEMLLTKTGWQRVEDLVAPAAAAAHRRASSARVVQRALKSLGESIGIESLHPHQLRRTYCVLYLQALKGDPESLMKLTQHMQWADMTTAMQYVDHIRSADMDSVAESLFDED